MSLQVWLPLLGNINNQGLADLTHTSGTPAYKTAGKIGQCLDLKTQVVFNCPNLNEIKEFSIAFWAKVNDDTSLTGDWVDVIGFTDKKADGTTGTLRWETCYSSSNKVRGISGHDNATYAITNGPNGNYTTKNVWHHIVCVVGTDVKEYRDGVLTGAWTANGGSLTGVFWLGQTNAINGEINDVRIYDHALSAKEVKELARGLVLHYKLDKVNGGNLNLLKNSTAIALTGSDYASNTSRTFDSSTGIGRIEILQLATWNAYAWVHGNYSDTMTNLAAGTKAYTFSIDIKVTGYVSGSVCATIDFRKSDHSSQTLFRHILTSEELDGNWHRVYGVGASNNGGQTMSLMCIHGAGTTPGSKMIIEYKNPKFELGDKATPWTPNAADSSYSALGYGVEYDCSGYGHNGTVIGAITNTSNSPRYNSSTHIGATTAKINVTGLTTSGFGSSYSFSWWAKCATWSNMMHWGFSDGVRLNGIYNGNLWNTGDGSNNPIYNIGTTTQVTVPSVNEWHHFVMTGNGTKCYVYKDGVLWAEAKTYKTISGTSIYINGWDSSTSYSNTNLDISDFRIYATALSAADVLELYQTSASIGNNGTVYAYELEEV